MDRGSATKLHKVDEAKAMFLGLQAYCQVAVTGNRAPGTEEHEEHRSTPVRGEPGRLLLMANH